MYTRMPLKMALRVASIGLLAGGCGVGGGVGLFGFFGNGGSSGHASGSDSSGTTQSVVTVASTTGGDDSGEQTDFGPSGSDVPVVTNPEPGTLLLFGGGLMAVAIRQRRRCAGRRRASRVS